MRAEGGGDGVATAWCSNKPVQIKHHSLVRVCLALERSERGARVAEIPALLSEHRRGNGCEHPGKTVAEPLCCVDSLLTKSVLCISQHRTAIRLPGSMSAAGS